MSFGESMFLAGFIQKTIKGDQIDKFNRTYPQRKQPQKVPKDLRGHHTESKAEAPPGGAGQPDKSAPASYVGSPPP
jgi:hypothetical protein